MDSLHTEEGQHVHYDALRPLALDVVSVQSMVVYGRVGNNVAWPVLQRAGLEAAIVPTVLFSNTPHYASIHGGAIPDDWFAGYLADLEARGALDVLRAVLVGYLGGPSQARMLAHWLPALKEQHPDLQIVIDPVMVAKSGDKLLADAAIATLRERLIPLATLITPNLPEAGELLGRPVTTRDDMPQAAADLLALYEPLGVPSVATSLGPSGHEHESASQAGGEGVQRLLLCGLKFGVVDALLRQAEAGHEGGKMAGF